MKQDVNARHAARRTPHSARIPEVSVCIVNWNCRDHLRVCLRSLRSCLQKVRLEIIVVDNGSTDGAPELVCRRFPRVKLIRNRDNAGFARANNQAATAACGRYLFFLNNDTIVPPGALRELIDYAETHPEAGLIGPQLRDGHGRTQVSCRNRPTIGALLHRTTLLRWTGLFRRAYRACRGRSQDLTTTHAVEVLMGAALLVSRKVFAECGPWDEGYRFGGEDIDLCDRIGRRYRVVYHPEVTIAHFGRVSSRRHVGFAHTTTIIGITRYLRRSGALRLALWLYKAAVTLDAPLQCLRYACRFLWGRLSGRRDRAAKCLRTARRRSLPDARPLRFLESVTMALLPDVSVCIVNWNCRDMLRDCLWSLHKQDQGVRVETVVVDNASNDGAADMVAAEFPDVLLTRNAANLGFCARQQPGSGARDRALPLLPQQRYLGAAGIAGETGRPCGGAS